MGVLKNGRGSSSSSRSALYRVDVSYTIGLNKRAVGEDAVPTRRKLEAESSLSANLQHLSSLSSSTLRRGSLRLYKSQ